MDVVKRLKLSWGVLVLCAGWLVAGDLWAGEPALTNYLDRAGMAEQQGKVPEALKIYSQATAGESNNAAVLCVLARRCCDLTYLAHSTALQQEALKQALACSLAAVRADSSNATAHASLAVCYARSCAFADIKTQLAYSRQFKREAETAIALDPKQDIAYYLLGRWNYEIASVGLLSRAYVRVIYGGLPKASYVEAIKNFKKALRLAPNRIIHHAALARAYEAVHEKELAVAELKKCRDLKPAGREDVDEQREAAKELEALGR
jgi:tetratricopeptide (TPR) repeat protein